ncbi:MAG: gamma-glutamyl-gamma-aminobutyrate hydrolase family protein [Planctomycetia bacterium]|nr:gamma-glutamyl-gamma-aminobutyrate hydrolase family protein [Planctomycetia bacterium]
MDSKPLIGVTADYRSTKKDSPAFTYIARGYYDAISAAGGVPIILPPLASEEDIVRLVDLVDAVVLVGGGDLNPQRDGFMLHPAVRPLDERRENFDRMLVRIVADRRMPVLGIGVGMQLLNVQQGGNLFLHLPEDMPKALPHKDAIDSTHRHGLVVMRNSLMERVYGDGEVRVNSMHHMAIDEVAPGFRVTATAPDGVIEAIECEQEDWFALGTQFHPEAESASALDQRIFDEFLEGVLSRGRMRMVA